MISKEYLDKFKKLYKDKYDITLTDEEATELANHFLNMMEVLIKPKQKRSRSLQNSNAPEEGSAYATDRL
jgi:transcriptional antiterminator